MLKYLRMPTLVLSQRYTADSSTLWRTAIAEGWNVERVLGYRCPEGIVDPVLYGETLFADAVCDQLGIALLQPSHDWLARLPERYLRRSVTIDTLGAAVLCRETKFVKPPDDKIFRAGLYDGAQLAEVTAGLTPDVDVLVSPPQAACPSTKSGASGDASSRHPPTRRNQRVSLAARRAA
jgi:hypothetical protein